MKLINYILESQEGDKVEYTDLKNSEKKILNLMLKKEIIPNIWKVTKFLKEVLIIDDLETIYRIVPIYVLNYNEAIQNEKGFSDLEKVKLHSETKYQYTSYHRLLSDYSGVPLLFVSEEYGGDIGDEKDTYLPEFSVFEPSVMGVKTYSIAGDYREALNAAKTKLYDQLDNEGWDSFNESFLDEYSSINEYWLERYAEDEAIEKYETSTEKQILEELDLIYDYENIQYEIKEYKEEIKNILLDIQEKEFEKDNIESDMIVIDRDIDSIDMYDDYIDSEYSGEINSLQQRYDELKEMLEEVVIYLEEAYKEKDVLDERLSEEREKLKELSGENLKERYIEEKKDIIMDDMQTSWTSTFVDDIGFTFDQAIADGAIDIDEEEVIDGIVENEGIDDILGTYDGYALTQDSFIFFRIN